MKTKTQAISEFLETQDCRVDLYTPAMEVQVNVIKGAERVTAAPYGSGAGGKTPVWTDGTLTWSAFRIPNKGAGINASPTYNDEVLEYPIEKCVEAIGLTGWNWFNRHSDWVGFDFDSITNHSQGLDDTELDELRDRVKSIPWITLRRSKSGKGYHIYVFFETPISTQNHTEHAALARAILSQLSGLLGFKFEDKVDTAGGILWVWHREASHELKSFKVIHSGTPMPRELVPSNWKDYIIGKKRAATRMAGNGGSKINELLSATKKHKLDEDHQRLLVWLANQPNLWWWDAEKSMLVTHTVTLKAAHNQLLLKGLYETTAIGQDLPHDHNCFAFPLSEGAWLVYRYSLNTAEDSSWGTSASGWTYCTLNKYPDFNAVCRRFKGVKTKAGHFKFSTFRQATIVLRSLGINLISPVEFNEREATLSPGKLDNEIIVSVPRLPDDPSMAEWYPTRGPIWERVVNSVIETRVIEPPDEVVRHVTTYESGSIWFVHARDRWIEKAKTDIRSALVALGFAKSEVENVLGMAVLEDWQEVVIPFEDEYPGNRQWNRKAPQFAVQPSAGPHPTWDSVFNHVGKNAGVLNDEWCRRYSVLTGADYLKLWYASVLRHSDKQLPYLFLVSVEQNTGKSIFHEAFQLLLKDGFGYTKADHALTSDSGFNGELYGSILAVVEEVDISKSSKALERIKDYVTSKSLFIRRLNQNGFMAANNSHWVQCANDPAYCPVFPGDTRTTVIYVDPLPVETEIPKDILLDKLRIEVPYILNTLLNLELPPPPGRLRIPVLESDTKGNIQDANRNRVMEFIDAQCTYLPGSVVSLKAFIQSFHSWLDDINERISWSSERVAKAIPAAKYPRGRYGAGGYASIGNLQCTGLPIQSPFESRVVRLSDGKLGASTGASE